jgi:signal transduction histidine kinase/ActR/RegA family two-component response regulator
MKRHAKKELPLRWKMILGTVAAVTVPCLIVGAVLYGMLSQSLLQIYRERSVQVAKDIATLINTTLQQELYFVMTLSFDPELVNATDSGNYVAAARKLEAIHAGIPSPNFTYLLADRKGIVRADAAFPDSIGLDLSDREYFRKAESGQASLYGPMRARMSPTSTRTSEIILMVCAPLKGRDGFSGIIAAAIRINHLTDIISAIRIGKTGYAYIVDAEGLTIVHPDETRILTTNLHDLPGMETITERMMRHETGSESYVFEGAQRIAGFAPITLTGWNAAFAQDRSEILAPINGILIFCVLSGLASIGLAIVFVIVLSRRITTPVEKMMDLLQRITAQSSDLILNIGVDRLIRFANPAAEKAMGSGPQGIVGMQPILTTVQKTPPQEIWKGLEEGKTWSGLVQLPGNRSEALTFTVIILPVRDHGGAIQSYLEIGKDITNELTLEARLRQSQKMEALGSMAGGIAHDFNNILGGIYGFSELSLSVKGNPAETEEYVRQIMQAAERARDLTRQILTFSRQTKLELKPVSLKNVTIEALKLMRASIPPTIEIRTILGSDSIILAEPTQIHQVIVNLCTNAVSALENTEGVIEVVLEDRDVDEGFARLHPGLLPGKHVLLRVSDSGAGIDPTIIERIFDPFFTTKPQGAGTGLGLSVVHGIVSKLNGSISVHSKPGRGTTFTILIPAARVEVSEIDPSHSIPAGGSERVLLVDDEPAIVKTVSSNLINLGYTVSAFSDGREALDVFAEDPRRFDILMTDNLMPHMGGIELARRFHELRPDIPVVLCSGYFSPGTDAAARAVGIQELLTKPLGIYQLATAIRRALAAREHA